MFQKRTKQRKKQRKKEQAYVCFLTKTKKLLKYLI